MYEFLVAVDHGDRHYPAGTRDPLKDWRRSHVRSALKAGLIRELPAEKEESHGEDRGQKRPPAGRRL